MIERDLARNSHERGRLTDLIRSLREEKLYELVNIINHNLLSEEETEIRPMFDSNSKLGEKTLREWNNPNLSSKLRAIHKIHFLADERDDIGDAQDIFENSLYTKPDEDDLIKPIEIQEAKISIYQFLEYIKAVAGYRKISPHAVPLGEFLEHDQLPKPLSEIADVVYNLFNAHFLDPRDEYMEIIAGIGQVLGYSISDISLLVIAKYYYRNIEQNTHHKDVIRENMLIGQLLREKILPIPSLKQLKLVYRKLRSVEKPLQELIGQLYDEVESSTQRLRT